MKCRFCNAKISKTDKKCPKCKKAAPQPEKKALFGSKKRAAIIFGSVGALVLAAVILFSAMLSGWDLGSAFSWLKPRENNVFYKNNYTVSDRVLARRYRDVIATMGEGQLTNELLQIYYWRQVYDFVENYSDSLTGFGLDYTGNMAKQPYVDGKSTWQQYFLEGAVQMWRTNYAFAVLARENGYELPEAYDDLLTNVHERLEESAKESGYASTEEMLLTEIGPGCTEAVYAEYLQTYYYGYLYFREMYEALEPTEEEIEKYFEDHKASLASSGISKDGTSCVEIRHIMLFPEGGTMTTDGRVQYTEEAWTVCRGLAETVMDRWNGSAKDEEAFQELVAKYSQDQTTNKSGGLYTGVMRGDLMTAIDEWCFASGRSSGDCTMIKTEYGYHIVYFVQAEEVWHYRCRTALQEAMGKKMVDDVLGEYTFVVNYGDIVIGKPKFSK